tara:strand:+ start:73 stop:513 length:441 start_codon:yes stop_codon:yes gene_type:complete
MDYYLYSHSNADGIFYIGKGCKGRESRYDRRSKEWYKASDSGYTTKIEAHGAEKDILALEKLVIKSLAKQGVKLVNKYHNPDYDYIKKGIPISDEQKKKLSDAMLGEKNHMFGKPQHPNQKYSQAKRWQHFRLAKANNYRRNGDEG